MTMTSPVTIQIHSANAFDRGLARGVALGETLSEGVSRYMALFDAVGVDLPTVRAVTEQSLVATEAWCAPLVDEMRGTAEGANLALWEIAALNARTEILSGATGAKPGECSTIVSTRPSPVGAQTWDWHEELTDYWHLQEVRGNDHDFVGLTEHGIVGKIGMNDAGVGIMLNILSHQDDRPGGVPVHLVCARVLAVASSLTDAVAILRTAPMRTSSAITVVSPEGAVVVELSPQGAAVLEPTDGVLLHTNHFIDGSLARREKKGIYDPDSQFRYAELAERAARKPLPATAEDLIPYLISHPGDAGQFCCVPAPGAALGDRWATLATVTLDATLRAMTVSAGSPLQATAHRTTRLVAGT
jgi:isopenicillin-N N-acyltransferase-like protein